MPTRHPRLALTRDEELDRALRRARETIGDGKSEAALARELILAGADVLAPEPEDEFVARLVRDFGARPARMTTEEWLRRRGPLAPYDPNDPYPVSKYLDELREDVV